MLWPFWPIVCLGVNIKRAAIELLFSRNIYLFYPKYFVTCIVGFSCLKIYL